MDVKPCRDPLETATGIVAHLPVISHPYLMDGEDDGWLRMKAHTLSPSECANQARETHAHAQDEDLAHEVIDNVARDHKTSGGWPGPEDMVRGLTCSYGKTSGEMGSLRMTDVTVTSGPRREICRYKFQVRQSS